MKPTIQEITDAVERLSCLRFFPPGDGAKHEIMRLLLRMVSTVERLNWLVSVMVDQVGTWYGPSELRGVYSQRWTPADGIGGWCVETPGFRALDSEAAYIENFHQEKLKEIESDRNSQIKTPMRRITG
jgi:hypothetical protein